MGNNLESAVLDELQCCVCRATVETKCIYQCNHGFTYCTNHEHAATGKTLLGPCNKCGAVPALLSVNTSLSRIAQLLNMPCRMNCGQEFPRHARQEHEIKCAQRGFVCRVQGCNFQNTREAYLAKVQAQGGTPHDWERARMFMEHVLGKHHGHQIQPFTTRGEVSLHFWPEDIIGCHLFPSSMARFIFRKHTNTNTVLCFVLDSSTGFLTRLQVFAMTHDIRDVEAMQGKLSVNLRVGATTVESSNIEIQTWSNQKCSAPCIEFVAGERAAQNIQQKHQTMSLSYAWNPAPRPIQGSEALASVFAGSDSSCAVSVSYNI